MKVSGHATLNAPPERVYAALNDPAVLARTIPGCQRLERVGQDAYRMTVTAGVASIKGSYVGDVRLTDQQAPTSFVLRAKGAGGPGTVHADVRVRLENGAGGTTVLSYAAEAVVGGAVGGVGQRVLAGVAKKIAGEFFTAVDSLLNAPINAVAAEVGPSGPVVPAGAGTDAPAVVAGAGAASSPGSTVFAAPATVGAGVGAFPAGFVRGAAFGATVALLGAIVGGLLARPRRQT